MASGNDVFAEPMLDSEEYLSDYFAQLKDLQQKKMLPDLKKEMDYKVYSIAGNSWGSHKSIVLTTDDKHFVTVELGFTMVGEIKHISPVTKCFDPILKSKLDYHGCIKTTGYTLISKAIATMKEFGMYFKYCNNCQDFCNMYLEAIDLQKAQFITDGGKVAIVVSASSFLLLLNHLSNN